MEKTRNNLRWVKPSIKLAAGLAVLVAAGDYLLKNPDEKLEPSKRAIEQPRSEFSLEQERVLRAAWESNPGQYFLDGETPKGHYDGAGSTNYNAQLL